MKSRLKEIRLEKELSQAKFAQRIGIPQSTYAMFETGDRELKDIHIKQICSEFNVNENWLRTGEGEMFIKTIDDEFEALAQKHKFDELDRLIFNEYITLKENERQVVKTLILNIAQKQITRLIAEGEIDAMHGMVTQKSETKQSNQADFAKKSFNLSLISK